MRPIAAVQGDTDMSNCGVAHRKLLLSQYEDNETCEVVCGTERWQAGAIDIFYHNEGAKKDYQQRVVYRAK